VYYMVQAFGVARFVGPNQKSPSVALVEINEKLRALGIADADVINVQVDADFYHIFYRKA